MVLTCCEQSNIFFRNVKKFHLSNLLYIKKKKVEFFYARYLCQTQRKKEFWL